MSRENRIIYGTRPERAYNIRQRLTMIDLQTGRERVYKTGNFLITVNPFSVEIGTTVEVNAIIDLVNKKTLDASRRGPHFLQHKILGGWFEDLIDENDQPGGRIGAGFRKLTEYLLTTAPGSQYTIEDWPTTNYYLLKKMFKKAFRNKNWQWGYSLFSPLELQNLIRERKIFPITFMKVREINLLDYAYLGTNKVRTIDDFVEFHNNIHEREGIHYDEAQFQLLLTNFLGGNGATTIEALRKQTRYRYVHEINVDIVSQLPLPFPLLPEESVYSPEKYFAVAESGFKKSYVQILEAGGGGGGGGGGEEYYRVRIVYGDNVGEERSVRSSLLRPLNQRETSQLLQSIQGQASSSSSSSSSSSGGGKRKRGE